MKGVREQSRSRQIRCRVGHRTRVVRETGRKAEAGGVVKSQVHESQDLLQRCNPGSNHCEMMKNMKIAQCIPSTILPPPPLPLVALRCVAAQSRLVRPA
jgi:hypothetical protein